MNDSSPGSGVRVLVVDDDPAVRHSVARMLSRRGMSVAMAEDGVRALEMLEVESVDVVLTDLSMPRLGGLELLERVKACPCDVEVVVMTGYCDDETAATVLKGGASHFLSKPFRSYDEVTIAISQAAERRKLEARAETLERGLRGDASRRRGSRE